MSALHCQKIIGVCARRSTSPRKKKRFRCFDLHAQGLIACKRPPSRHRSTEETQRTRNAAQVLRCKRPTGLPSCPYAISRNGGAREAIALFHPVLLCGAAGHHRLFACRAIALCARAQLQRPQGLGTGLGGRAGRCRGSAAVDEGGGREPGQDLLQGWPPVVVLADLHPQPDRAEGDAGEWGRSECGQALSPGAWTKSDQCQ